ncbi:MAG: LamG-like jellyroll fold domain-containing protein [Phycisphaerae bacterium]
MSKYLSILAVLVLCGAGVANAALIHQYDPATDSWEDQAGSVDLTAQNGASIDASTGYFSNAFTFDGTDDYAATDDNYQNDWGDDVTFELWVKFDRLNDSTEADQVIFEQGGANGAALTLNDAGQLTWSAGKKANAIRVSFDLTTLSAEELGDFVQIVGIRDGTNTETRLLVNGGNKVLEDEVDTNPNGADQPIGLGGGSDSGNDNVGSYDAMTGEPTWETLNGQVGIVNVYDNAMTDTEVETAFNAIIPEPATMSLLALGGLGVLIRRKK